MAKDPQTLLFTGAGGLQGLTLVRMAQALGHAARPVVFSMHTDDLTRYEVLHYVQAPPMQAEDEYLAALEATVAAYGVRWVFPATEYDLALLSEAQATYLARGVHIAVPPPGILPQLLDKKALYEQVAPEAGIQALPTLSLAQAIASGKPVIAKPRRGWGSKGLRVYQDAAALEAAQEALAQNDADILCPYLEAFEEYSVDAAIAPEGGISPVLVRRRVRTTGGYAAITEGCQEPPVAAAAQALLSWLSAQGCIGIYNLQFLCTADGGCYLSDLNPRVGTSATYGLGMGINLLGHMLGHPQQEARHALW